MTQPIVLIKRSEPVRMMAMTPGRGRSPSVAVVYVTRTGDLEVLDGGKPMRWGDQIMTRYRARYEVDISDHYLTFEFKDDLALPTQADVYHFHATVSASFRVADPAEVIRRDVQDAVPLVRGHLLGVCRPITRLFSIEEAEEAEAAIHARFRRDTLIQGGISLYAVEVRLSLDEAGRTYLQAIEQAARDEKINTAQHLTNVGDEKRQGELDLIRQARDHARQERERLMLGGQPMDAVSMVRLHLQRNPSDTAGAMKMLSELEQVRFAHEQKQTDRMQSLLAGFARDGLVNPAEVSPLVEAVMRYMESSAGALERSPDAVMPVQGPAEPQRALDWDEPLDDIIEPVPPAAEARPANLSPVYLLIDESVTEDLWTDGLTTVLTELFGDLTAQPRVAAALRLAVLGFADTVAEHVPLGKVPGAAAAPELVGRGPAADHATLFRWLHERVNAHLDLLRTQHQSVRPPLFVLLCATAPRDDAWEAPRRQLLRAARRAEIVAFGVQDAATSVADLASGPDLAFAADGVDTGRAIGLFAAFLHQHLVDVAQAALDGTEAPVPAPTGFRAME
jgi:uncharacterized protein YegL